ncbi:MAG TPA: 6-phosphogluconolactonase [Candidatus Acidoferrales bacterium]|nr:6-phosphogluconolactonase [Candidatus Acidoferrales bacterium]
MDDAGTTRNLLPREIRPGVFVCMDAESVARAASRYFVEWAWQAIAQHGVFRVALSGGSTPRAFYRCLASDEYRLQVDWAKVHLYWGDERAVPPTDPESNYGMARAELLIRVPIPPGNIHRMEAERPELGRAAEAYEDLLRSEFEKDDRGFPRFDLILLGVGNDGHTASIFPGAKGLRGTSRWVSTPWMPHLAKRRMTLTLPVLNAAHRVLFLAAGPEKAEILRDVVERPLDPPLPVQLVVVPQGQRMFLVDEAAAALLRPLGGTADDPSSNLQSFPDARAPRKPRDDG